MGYCQGFNVIAALLLDIMDRKEDDAFKVRVIIVKKIYHSLPIKCAFCNNGSMVFCRYEIQ